MEDFECVPEDLQLICEAYRKSTNFNRPELGEACGTEVGCEQFI